jgi:hypothetical protein
LVFKYFLWFSAWWLYSFELLDLRYDVYMKTLDYHRGWVDSYSSTYNITMSVLNTLGSYEKAKYNFQYLTFLAREANAFIYCSATLRFTHTERERE